MSDNILRWPKTRAQLEWLDHLARRDRLMRVEINVLPDEDPFRHQRAWRILFGLYQDCACVRWSKGFTKSTEEAFSGRMRSSMLEGFLHEALPFVAEQRARICIDGKLLRRRLLALRAA